MENDSEYMTDLILALHVHGVPLEALNLRYFTKQEQEWITSSYAEKFLEIFA
jgi:hypothetical protein